MTELLPEEFGPKIRVIGRTGILVDSPKTLKFDSSSSFRCKVIPFADFRLLTEF